MTRMEKIKKRLFEVEYVTKKEWWGQNETILTGEAVAKEPLVVRKALGVEHTMRYMPVEIKPDELIVGIATMAATGLGHEFPEYALPEEKEEALKSSFTVKSVWGHHPANYETVLRKGCAGIRRDIEEKVREECRKETPDQGKLDLYRAMEISLNAVKTLADRYVRLCAETARDTRDEARRAELLELARICARVPEQPAETLHEALQGMFLFFCALHSTLEWTPIGRPDQYFHPYYEKDLREGRLTEARAEELVGSWLAKFSERVQILPENFETDHVQAIDQIDGGDPAEQAATFFLENDAAYNYGTSANNFLLNMILGGLTRDGADATNALTYMILRQWSFLEAIMPVASVRFHKDSPKELYGLCAEILRRGSGEPAIYNDEVIVPGLVQNGVPIEDARDYSNDGCWEVLIPGKTNFQFAYIKVLQILEYMLFRGHSLLRGVKEAPDLGDPCAILTFEEFYGMFLRHVELRIEEIIQNKLKYYKDRYKIAPSPLLSSVMDDCVERGLDLTVDGARYNMYALMVSEFSNFVDSLAVIKKLVFEERSLSMGALIEALRCDFQGYETLREKVINRVPKFGNDEPYADELAGRVLRDIEQASRRVQERIGHGNLVIGLGIATFETYMSIGYNIGASANGRLARESVASNFSPTLGMDLAGPTAAVKSVCAPDLLPYYHGCPLDLQINANEIEGQAGLARMAGLIRSFIDLGGVILTLTTVHAEEMEDAQRHPERHRNLRVRMGGLSAYFVALSREHQDVLIHKVKHSL